MNTGIISTEKIGKLISQKKYAILHSIISEAEPQDIAEIFESLTKEQYPVLFRILPKELAAEVFVELPAEKQQYLIELFSDSELRAVLDELFLDDTVDIIEEMPATVVKRILENSTNKNRKSINELLRYPDDSAGSIMTTEYVCLKRQWTVDQAFALIRKVAIDKETIYTCYVTDENRKLIGMITAVTLLISDRDAKIQDIMDEHVISVSTLEDQEEVTQLIKKYDVLALPVVDAENRLVGIITVDDAIDVMQDEAEEDFAKMAAITPNEKPYLKMSVREIWKTRIPWLMLLMISATFTSLILSKFEDALSKIVILTAYIPMLMDTGGNSGSQASVTVIRGISLGEVTFTDLPKVLWKEFRTALLCGITLGGVSFFKILLVDRLILGSSGITIQIALVICLTLCCTILCAKLIGCSLPLLAEKLGFDPAVMASPFITTIVDAVSLLVYMGLASMILHLGAL